MDSVEKGEEIFKLCLYNHFYGKVKVATVIMVIVAQFHISEIMCADINMYYCDLSYQKLLI